MGWCIQASAVWSWQAARRDQLHGDVLGAAMELPAAAMVLLGARLLGASRVLKAWALLVVLGASMVHTTEGALEAWVLLVLVLVSWDS